MMGLTQTSERRPMPGYEQHSEFPAGSPAQSVLTWHKRKVSVRLHPRPREGLHEPVHVDEIPATVQFGTVPGPSFTLAQQYGVPPPQCWGPAHSVGGSPFGHPDMQRYAPDVGDLIT